MTTIAADRENLTHQRLRFIHISRLFLALLLLLPPASLAEDYTYITNNGTITITGYTGPGGVVTIPSVINGLPVTSVGNSAFYSRANLAGIIIPASVSNIGESAFQSCRNLTNTTISETVTNIGNSAFSFCTSLISLPLSSNTIRIGDFAFQSCVSLTDITIPNGVSSIGNAAFANCVGVTNVTISETVTSIGTQPFHYCTRLIGITVHLFNSAYSSSGGVLFNKSQTVLLEYPGGRAGGYSIPVTVLKIAGSAFQGCTELTDVVIPDSVTNIGYWAFYGCTGLTGITIPDSVLSIEYLAFSGCTGLTNIAIPRNTADIGYQAFTYCTSMTGITVDESNPTYSSATGVLFNKNQTTLIQCPAGKVGSYIIPAGVGDIGDSAFWGCRCLTNIVLPSSVVTIEKYAFTGCTNLTSLVIPSSVTNIGNYAFDDCSSLQEVYFQGNAPAIGYDIFYYANFVLVYYLPGTTGWGATFGGRPTALWNPQFQASDSGFGVQNNRFGFNIAGTANIPIVLEACTNLASPVWQPLQSCTLTNGSIYFGDSNWTNFPSRLYRIRSP